MEGPGAGVAAWAGRNFIGLVLELVLGLEARDTGIPIEGPVLDPRVPDPGLELLELSGRRAGLRLLGFCSGAGAAAWTEVWAWRLEYLTSRAAEFLSAALWGSRHWGW